MTYNLGAAIKKAAEIYKQVKDDPAAKALSYGQEKESVLMLAALMIMEESRSKSSTPQIAGQEAPKPDLESLTNGRIPYVTVNGTWGHDEGTLDLAEVNSVLEALGDEWTPDSEYFHDKERRPYNGQLELAEEEAAPFNKGDATLTVFYKNSEGQHLRLDVNLGKYPEDSISKSNIEFYLTTYYPEFKQGVNEIIDWDLQPKQQLIALLNRLSETVDPEPSTWDPDGVSLWEAADLYEKTFKSWEEDNDEDDDDEDNDGE